ncbi:hypothetical protein Scep_026658 [Stephania cephalantha]|uniref:Uncharacterized protein n=1 Tax=Stephania cephalantha TaxID=152367 RepID=A0AAP0HQM4_9MAGN
MDCCVESNEINPLEFEFCSFCAIDELRGSSLIGIWSVHDERPERKLSSVAKSPRRCSLMRSSAEASSSEAIREKRG